MSVARGGPAPWPTRVRRRRGGDSSGRTVASRARVESRRRQTAGRPSQTAAACRSALPAGPRGPCTRPPAPRSSAPARCSMPAMDPVLARCRGSAPYSEGLYIYSAEHKGGAQAPNSGPSVSPSPTGPDVGSGPSRSLPVGVCRDLQALRSFGSPAARLRYPIIAGTGSTVTMSAGD